MLTNLVSMITKSLSSSYVAPTNKTAMSNHPISASTDSENPILATTFGTSSYYGKNQPVEGGYFAGYYNGKPNIVGTRLFIEA